MQFDEKSKNLLIQNTSAYENESIVKKDMKIPVFENSTFDNI